MPPRGGGCAVGRVAYFRFAYFTSFLETREKSTFHPAAKCFRCAFKFPYTRIERKQKRFPPLKYVVIVIVVFLGGEGDREGMVVK